jgi:hypothetical protein
MSRFASVHTTLSVTDGDLRRHSATRATRALTASHAGGRWFKFSIVHHFRRGVATCLASCFSREADVELPGRGGG